MPLTKPRGGIGGAPHVSLSVVTSHTVPSTPRIRILVRNVTVIRPGRTSAHRRGDRRFDHQLTGQLDAAATTTTAAGIGMSRGTHSQSDPRLRPTGVHRAAFGGRWRLPVTIECVRSRARAGTSRWLTSPAGERRFQTSPDAAGPGWQRSSLRRGASLPGGVRCGTSRPGAPPRGLAPFGADQASAVEPFDDR